jgi:hypothetical protein
MLEYLYGILTFTVLSVGIDMRAGMNVDRRLHASRVLVRMNIIDTHRNSIRVA